MDPKTVKIKSTGTEAGYMIINEEDFVEGEHELFLEGAEAEKAAAEKTAAEKAEADRVAAEKEATEKAAAEKAAAEKAKK